jgi:hypothetical protein
MGFLQLQASMRIRLRFWSTVNFTAVAVWSVRDGFSVLHIVSQCKYELSYDKDRPALFSKTGFLGIISIEYVHFIVSNFLKNVNVNSGVSGWGGFKIPALRNSEILKTLSQIPTSVEHTSISVTNWYEYGIHSFANWAEPLTRGLPTSDPRFLCPSPQQNLLYPSPPPTNKIPGYSTECQVMYVIELFNSVLELWLESLQHERRYAVNLNPIARAANCRPL